MTAHTLVAHEMGLAVLAEGDGLMAAVHAGNVAPAAADALLSVEDREDDGVAVQVARLDEFGQLLAYKGREFGDATAGHIVLQSQGKVVDDTVAILHDRGAHLQVAAAQLDELECVLPRLDATNAAQAQVLHHGILRHLEDEAQGDGFDGASRQS